MLNSSQMPDARCQSVIARSGSDEAISDDQRITIQGVVVSVNISSKTGTRKRPVDCALLLPNCGLKGDAHAAPATRLSSPESGGQARGWHRQVSLLAQESIDKVRHLGIKVGPGDFAENITTRGINLCSLPIGSRLQVGEAKLQVTQIGKACNDRCAIYYQAGDCVMPKEGIFAKVVEGGKARVGDEILLCKSITKASLSLSCESDNDEQ